MFKLLSFSFLTLLVSAQDLPQGKVWAHEESDIAVDSKATFGTLPNGFRYIVYPNAEPPGRVSLRLHLDSGSLNEADDQQGIAHFLEHMLFAGSTNYTAEELIPEMQRLGIGFGAHANAYTSFDETVYKLDLPNLNEPTIDLGFTVMRDFCDGALLEEQEIEDERGVILSEKNSRDSVDFRLMKKQFEYLTPNFLVANRFPIGTEECIKSCPPERVRDYYRDFYDPKLMTFVVVGDIDAKVYEQKIIDAFSSLTSPTHEVTKPDIGTITEPKELTVKLFTDPEVDEDDISLMRVTKNQSVPDQAHTRQERYTMSLASAMLAQRFNKLSKAENSPINGGACYKFTWFDEVTYGNCYVTPTEGKWKEAVPLLENEFRRAILHGFTYSEFKEVTANLLTSAKQAAAAFATRTSPSIADTIVPTFGDRKVISTAQEDLRVVEELLANLTPQDCHQAFKAYWDVPGLYLVLTTEEASESDKELLHALYSESQNSEVIAPEEEDAGTFAYTSFGEASTITTEKHIEDLDAHQLTLSNGIRVNLKKTDFESGKVYLTARLGEGLESLKDLKPGWSSYASSLLNMGGLGEHSTDDLKQLLSGKVVGLSFAPTESSFVFSGMTNQADLELQLQLLGAYLVDPGYRPEADRLYKKSLPDQFEQLTQTLEGALQYMSAFEHGDDARYRVATEEEAQGFSSQDVSSLLNPIFKNAPLEISLVGDLDLEATKQAVLKVLGADFKSEARLNQERTETQPLADLPKTGQSKSFDYKSKIDRAASIITWRTQGLTDNISESRRLSLVSSILANRMRDQVREELGSSYSPYAYSDMNSSFDNYGNIKAVSICKPADMQTIADLVIKIGKEFATNGATQDELDRVQKPALSNLESSLRNNSYWLNTVLASSQEEPKRLDWARSRTADYTKATVEEINTLAKTYLNPQNAITYLVAPESK